MLASIITQILVQIQIIIATEECKKDTYALLIYNDRYLTESDRMQIGFSSGAIFLNSLATTHLLLYYCMCSSGEKYYSLSDTENGSNIGVPGVFAFRIDKEDIIDPNSGKRPCKY